MKNLKLIILIAFGSVIGCVNVWGEKPSAQITVETSGRTPQTISMYESGKMYFSGDFLVFESSAESNQNPVKFDLKEIEKLLFSAGDASKVDDALYVSSFNVSPNPAKDFITLQFPFDEERPYSICDMRGNIVKSGSISSGEKINVESLSAGMYLINIR